ncbi:putative baseplate assembly protein [Azoarcus communis]|uniref:putative baseplate assembly protein n=1 Tax=Parazoarcus communis TaxID=41977 RepID=UPI001459897A|nr:putative baseplate assembly protein [Parazoarcus communis]NMG49715.1 putative baseplate assembly protein [Parazoarcus communis]
MPLIAPILDDRSFEALYNELRNRIPVYNPEWTDHLDSDPAITLLQLFAWLGEGLQFRFNQIPEATQLAFLRLLDIPLQPARAARALVRFDSKARQGVALYAGDQVKAGKLRYTLTHDASLWPLDCVAVARRSLLPEQDLADPARLRAFVAGLDPEQAVAVQASIDALALADDGRVAPYEVLTLGSDGQDAALDFADTVDGCVWIGLLTQADSGLDPAALADPATGLQPPPGRPVTLSLGFSPATHHPTLDDIETPCGSGDGPGLIWQISLAQPRKDGSADYTTLRIGGDSTAGFTRDGVVRIELPAALNTLGNPPAAPGLAGTGDFPPELDDARAERLWCWLRVWRSDGSRIGTVRLLALNTLACEQAVRASPELLGSGSGQPGQIYRLANAPVLIDSTRPVRLQVEESGVWTEWQRVDDFDASTADDRHFRIDAEAGIASFGTRYPQTGERIRVLAYHWGGGSAGNVPAAAIDRLGDTLAGPTPALPMLRPHQTELKLSNPLPAGGGVDAESLESALARIPATLRRNHRAVARDDFAELALQTPTVELGRAECLPLFHAPSKSPRPGAVSVVVWPARDVQHPDAPLPDARELTEVCAWLDRWRLVTTELYVIPPTYRRIAIAVAVKVAPGYGLDAVRDWVETLLRQYLAPLPPYGPDGRGWPLGRRLLGRELEGVTMQVEGLEYIEALRVDVAHTLADGSEQWTAASVIEFEGWQLPTVAAVTVVSADTPLPPPGSGLAPPPSHPAVPVPVLREEC